jgi:hypothetical protein
VFGFSENKRMRTIATALLLSLIACRSDGPTGPTASLAGSWALSTVNGQPLPFLIGANDTARVDLVSELIVVTPAATFSRRKDFQVTLTGLKFPSFDVDSGTVSLEGSVATLTFAGDGSKEIAATTDSTITFTGVGFVAVFRRK